MINQIAARMGIAKADVQCSAQSIANSMEQDGVTPDMITVDLMLAYAAHAVRKMEQFTTTYQTNPGARAEFQRAVRALL